MEDKAATMKEKIDICDLANQEKTDEIKELVRDPQFMCSSCGRVADAKDNLCKPLAVYELMGGVSFD
jgi:hypothetical protein